jgi:Spy/CpxP family protein refolding chaperone
MKTSKKIFASGAIVGTLLLTCFALPPTYGQSNTAETQAFIGFTFGLLSPRLLSALNLTHDQITRIEASKKTLREANKTYIIEVTALRKDVADRLFGTNPVREADVAAQVSKIADLREKILRDGFRIALEVRQTLRPDQLAKAAAIRQQLLDIQSEVRELYNEK